MPEGRRFLLRLQPAQVRALERAGEVLGIGDVQRTIYHCINLGLQQCALVVGQRDQTSILNTMMRAQTGQLEVLEKHAAKVVEAYGVGGPVTPPHSAQTGTPGGVARRKGRRDTGHD